MKSILLLFVCLFFICLSAADLYVSPQGSNLNTGLDADNPLLTINYACEISEADEENPVTIYLAEGIYSPSTNGEAYPVNLPDYVSLVGVSQNLVTLDAQSTGIVINVENCQDILISDLSVMHGYGSTISGYFAGGINLEGDSVYLRNLLIKENHGMYGGGISNSVITARLSHLEIIDNYAEMRGGGIADYSYNTQILNTLIADNYAERSGGGIYSGFYPALLLNVTIVNNVSVGDDSDRGGGGIFIHEDYDTVTLFNSIVIGNEPENIKISSGSYNDAIFPVGYSLIEDGVNGMVNNQFYYRWLEGNFEFDPQFTDPENGDYTLLQSSPCINAGINEFYFSDNINFFIPEDEYSGCAPDVGYFEHVNDELYCRFRADKWDGSFPLQVRFYDISDGNPVSWEWDFNGDHVIDSYDQNPLWNFLETGEYDIELTVTDDLGNSSAELKFSFITVYPQNIHNLNQDAWYYEINDAMHKAADGDTLIIEPGVYSQNIRAYCRPVTIASKFLETGDRSYIENTVIDGGQNGPVVIADYIFDDTLNVCGLTLTNGYTQSGGGICNRFGNTNVDHCVIVNNHAVSSGGGIFHKDGELKITNSVIAFNEAEKGGGIATYDDYDITIHNCSIMGNFAEEQGSAYYVYDEPNVFLINSILWNENGNEVYYDVHIFNYFTVAYSDVQGGEDSIILNGYWNLLWLDGNIDSLPLFEDPAQFNFDLCVDSPCIDAGIAEYYHGTNQLINLSPDQYLGIAPDMGACEYDSTVSISYGDIDDNNIVESYDAALLLQYVVGIDPLPEDPAPWEDWRVLRADVDLDGDLLAFDAALILQYVLNIIEELPYTGSRNKSECEIFYDDNYIYISANDETFSIAYNALELKNISLKQPEIIPKDCLSAYNENKFALAAYSPVKGTIAKIPYELSKKNASILLSLECNGKTCEKTISFLDSAPSVTYFKSIYPNPFNPETTISFSLAQKGNITIEIFNLKGQKVKVLLNETRDAGDHEIFWNAENYNSGIYFIKMKSNSYSNVKKVILLK